MCDDCCFVVVCSFVLMVVVTLFCVDVCHNDTRQQHRCGGCEGAGTGTEEFVPVDVAGPCR